MMQCIEIQQSSGERMECGEVPPWDDKKCVQRDLLLKTHSCKQLTYSQWKKCSPGAGQNWVQV